MHVVKNGFSDLTKEQEDQDRQGKDITNDRQGKALREGCHERKKAWTSVSSREKKEAATSLMLWVATPTGVLMVAWGAMG